MGRFYTSEYEYTYETGKKNVNNPVEESDEETVYSDSDIESLIYCEPGRSLLPPEPLLDNIKKTLYDPMNIDTTDAYRRYMVNDYEFVLEETEGNSTCSMYRFWGTGIVSSIMYKTVQSVNWKKYDIGLTHYKASVYLFGEKERWIQEAVDSPLFDKTIMYLMRERKTGECWLVDLMGRRANVKLRQ